MGPQLGGDLQGAGLGLREQQVGALLVLVCQGAAGLEGAQREFAVLTQRFEGENGKVKALHGVHVDDKMQPIAGSEFKLKADLVLLAMGFVHPVHEGLLKTLGVEIDPRGNVRAATTDYRTSLPKVFSAGDMRRGQSLVVWAIREGRQCARSVDTFLMGRSTLPR